MVSYSPIGQKLNYFEQVLLLLPPLGFSRSIGEEVVKLLVKVEDNREKCRAPLIALLLATDIGVSLSSFAISLLPAALGNSKWEIFVYFFCLPFLFIYI